MPYDRIQTGNGVTIKEAVKAYKQGYESRGSKIRVISATKTQIHFEIITHRGKPIDKSHPIQGENYDSQKNRRLKKKIMKRFGMFGA